MPDTNAFSDSAKGAMGASAPGVSGFSGLGAALGDTTASAPSGTQAGGANAPAGTPASPASGLASGIGSILLFPGRIIVSQFAGTSGDALDSSHLPITILLSAAAWYGAYWYFFVRGAKRSRKQTGGDE